LRSTISAISFYVAAESHSFKFLRGNKPGLVAINDSAARLALAP
jgi:hypothetical protein